MRIRTRSRGTGGSKEASPGCLIAFFGIFLVMGLIFTGVMVTLFVKRIQTRTWDDDQGRRHWKTEIVASNVEMLSGRTKKDYAAELAADALEATAGTEPGEPAVDPTEPAVEADEAA